MEVGNIIGLVVYLLTAAIMIGIGISQYKSEKPVGFYSGEKPPDESELSDVVSWNKKHAVMWVIYGLIILFSYGIGTIIGDSVWCLIPMCGGLIFPLPIMVWYHHRLIKHYKKT